MKLEQLIHRARAAIFAGGLVPRPPLAAFARLRDADLTKLPYLGVLLKNRQVLLDEQ